MPALPSFEEVARGERSALARAMNLLESSLPADREAARALVDRAALSPRPGVHIVGLTGPPGVGKSTLAGRLIAAWRARGRAVGVVAVDPSSRRSGGALLGDRARMAAPAEDEGVYIRSMAARDRLGGLAPATFDAVLVLAAGCDVVLIETVGVGQSETDVTHTADTTVVVVQPASGDTLQFLKAGLMEVPDVLAVNKADLGAVAERTMSDLAHALDVLGVAEVPILATSATTADGIEALADALETRRARLEPDLAALRRERLLAQCLRRFTEAYGTLRVEALGGPGACLQRLRSQPADAPPSALISALVGA